MLGLVLGSSTTTAPTSSSPTASTATRWPSPIGPYRIGSLRYDVSCVLTNKVQQGFFRGAGADPGNFILERLVDTAADRDGDRPRRAAPAELHPARPVPVQGPDGQHLRQRRLRGRARQGARRSPGWTVARRAGAAARRGPLHRHRPGDLPGALGLQRHRVVVPLRRQPPLPATSTPESCKIDVDAIGRRPRRRSAARCGATAPRPSSARSSPRSSASTRRRLGGLQRLHQRRDLGRARRQPRDDHALGRDPRRRADHQGQDDPGRGDAMEMDAEDVECVEGVCRAKGAPGKSMTMAEVGMRAHLFNESTARPRAAVSSRCTPTTTRTSRRPREDRSDLGAFYPMVSHACHIPIVEVDAGDRRGEDCEPTTS